MNRSRLVSKLLACGSAVAIAAAAPHAMAAPPPPVDVVIHSPPPPSRKIVVLWNPISFFTIGKLSADVIIAPGDHHALVISPFYASTETRPIYVFDDSGTATALPKQRFRGFGAELGYRYFFEKGGPRGLFVGPSLIVGSFAVDGADGSRTPFVNYGLALDAAYEMLVADRIALIFGGGLQYTASSKSLPDQQFPAQIYANSALRPRALLALGWAF